MSKDTIRRSKPKRATPKEGKHAVGNDLDTATKDTPVQPLAPDARAASPHCHGYPTRAAAGLLTTRHLGWARTDRQGGGYRQVQGPKGQQQSRNPEHRSSLGDPHEVQSASHKHSNRTHVLLPHESQHTLSGRSEQTGELHPQGSEGRALKNEVVLVANRG